MQTKPPQEVECTDTDHPQERRARELLTQDPMFLGVDGSGAAHYWDSYEFAVAVVEDDDARVVQLDDSPFGTLAEWCEYTRTERGWETGPRAGGSLVGDLRRGLER